MPMNLKKIKDAAVLIAFLAVMLWTSYGSTEEKEDKQIYIGVACYDQKDTFLGELMEAFKDECSLKLRDTASALLSWMLPIPREHRMTRCRK